MVLVVVTIKMLAILEKERPRTTRVQRNQNGQWSITLPIEVAEGAELELKDTVKFTVKGPGRILIEVLR